MIIKHRIEKAKEGTYYTIPFEVPENTDRLTVSYKYDKQTQGITGQKPNPNIIDLGLINAKGSFVGWSGSSRDSVTVALHGGTEGYFRQRIESGTWQIIIGAYKINSDFTDVEYTVTFEEKKHRFYLGDLHTHTVASDGKYTAYELGMMAKKKGLDFIANADHNNYSENYSLPRIDGITFIPAVEWTHYKGHLNLFGVKAPFENSFVANTKEDMQHLIENAKKAGATVSVNHPKCTLCPYLWGDDKIFDMIEVWNGPMRKINMDAIEWWTELLNEGRKIPIVGGSDFHSITSLFALPVTAVYSDSADAEALMENIRAGHCYITSSVKGAKLFIKAKDGIMGDTVKPENGEVTLNIETGSLKNTKLILVTANGERPLKNRGGNFTVKVNADEKFAYLKAVKTVFSKSFVTAVTNAIYFGEEELS